MELDDFEKQLETHFRELRAVEQTDFPSFEKVLNKPVSDMQLARMKKRSRPIYKIGVVAAVLLLIVSITILRNPIALTETETVAAEMGQEWTLAEWEATTDVLLTSAYETEEYYQNENSSISTWEAPSSSLMPNLDMNSINVQD